MNAVHVSSFKRKSPIFEKQSEIRERVASILVAHSHILFCFGRLAMPLLRHDISRVRHFTFPWWRISVTAAASRREMAKEDIHDAEYD